MTAATAFSTMRRRPGLLLPLLLIALGATLLAINLGYVDGHAVHAVAHLSWPVLLVLIGVEVALARRQPFLALAAELVIIAAAAGAIALTQPDGLLAPVGDGTHGHDWTHHNAASDAHK